jgi:hypothetical protein
MPLPCGHSIARSTLCEGFAGGCPVVSSGACTHDAASLSNLKKLFFVTRRLLYRRSRRAQILHLSKKPEETQCTHNFLRDCSLTWGKVFLQCETRQGYAMRGASSVKVKFYRSEWSGYGMQSKVYNEGALPAGLHLSFHHQHHQAIRSSCYTVNLPYLVP